MVRIGRVRVQPAQSRAGILRAIYERAWRELARAEKAPAVDVRFCRFASDRSIIEARDGRVSVRISDLLEGAPLAVLEALAYILVARLLRRPVPAEHHDRYRRFLNRRDFRRRLHLIRQVRGRKQYSPPRGRCFDLVEIFEELNRKFFNGLMARPALGWSRKPSRTRLGHYDPSHNAIVISSWLDRPEVPRLVLDYVVYHEMLHLKYPVEHSGPRRRVHTRRFVLEEKRFPELQAAKEALRTLQAAGIETAATPRLTTT
jgi:hypothetical protein